MNANLGSLLAQNRYYALGVGTVICAGTIKVVMLLFSEIFSNIDHI